MIQKLQEREKAITLRKKGYSYREILEHVPVAKSTLSLWLGEVGLSKKQKQRITEKRIAAALRGARSRYEERVRRTQRIKESARREITSISARELHIIGVMLYWAEGSKEKEARPGSRAYFTNSDPEMIKVFLRWLLESCSIPRVQIVLEIYIHESHKDRIGQVIAFWASVTRFPRNHFTRIYFKKNKIKTNRTNTGENYHGLLRVAVLKSADLNRRIAGCIEGVVQCMNS